MQSSLFAVGVMEIQTESFARQVSPESFELGCRGLRQAGRRVHRRLSQ
jgi:hypothetical protein